MMPTVGQMVVGCISAVEMLRDDPHVMSPTGRKRLLRAADCGMDCGELADRAAAAPSLKDIRTGKFLHYVVKR